MRVRSGIGRLRRLPATVIFGAVVINCYVLLALFAPVLAPFGESQVVGVPYDVWSAQHLLGTDNLGRDMLSRLLFGARNTVGVAIAITALAFALGVSAGMLSAVRGGRVDVVAAVAADTMMAIPLLILALLLLTVFGTSVVVLVAVIAVLDSSRIYRIARALTHDVVALDFIEAARLRGESSPYIAFSEVLPNIAIPLLAEFGIRFCYVFLLISALSFLGVGLQPPSADWGSMVRDNATLIAYGDITPLLPAFAIGLLTIAVNLAVDGFGHRASDFEDG